MTMTDTNTALSDFRSTIRLIEGNGFEQGLLNNLRKLTVNQKSTIYMISLSMANANTKNKDGVYIREDGIPAFTDIDGFEMELN